jgi:hypothetical protein
MKWWSICLLVTFLTIPFLSFSQVTLTTDFEGSNLATWTESSAGEFDLTIRQDTASSQFRWYSFKVLDASGQHLTFNITNAGQANAAPAFSFNKPRYSPDEGASWGHINSTSYNGSVFTFSHTIESATEWIALGVVYNFSRWQDLVASSATHPHVTGVEILTDTLEGRPLEMLVITDPNVSEESKEQVWVIARQHPAEIGGSWVCEGLVEWLLGGSLEAENMLDKSIFHIVGFMNPDGVVHGNYRLNTLGLNLNREWNNPNPLTEPTVAAVEQRMIAEQNAGAEITIFIDLHSHSSLRKNYFYYQNAASTSQEAYEDIRQLMMTYESYNPDFTFSQSESGSDSDIRLAENWASEVLGVPAVTFETSYQDVTYGPFAGQPMTRERYKDLGGALGMALSDHYFAGLAVIDFQMY